MFIIKKRDIQFILCVKDVPLVIKTIKKRKIIQ